MSTASTYCETISPDQSDAASPNGESQSDTRNCELVVDWPNLQGTAVDLNGGRRSEATRIDLNSLVRYLGSSPADSVAGTIFIRNDRGDGLLPLINAFRAAGFGAFVRPNADIDDQIVEHLETRRSDITDIIIITHDKELIDRCVAALDPDTRVTILGFRENSRHAVQLSGVTFVDLGEVPGLVSEHLERCTLGDLPSCGRLFPPRRAISRG